MIYEYTLKLDSRDRSDKRIIDLIDEMHNEEDKCKLNRDEMAQTVLKGIILDHIKSFDWVESLNIDDVIFKEVYTKKEVESMVKDTLQNLIRNINI